MIDPIFEYFKKRSEISQRIYHSEGKGVCKGYARFPKIILPPASPLLATLQEALCKRLSTREYAAQPLSLQEISTLLFWSAGIVSDRKLTDATPRAHPSGGARYPIEIYPVILNGRGIQKGVYHYNVEKHILEHLKYVNVSEVLKCFGHFRSEIFVNGAGIILLLSFIKGHSMQKYGEFSYKLGLIEGGHIGQNIYLVSTSLGLGCCAVGDCDTETLHNLLRFDGVNENLFYTFSIGYPAAS